MSETKTPLPEIDNLDLNRQENEAESGQKTEEAKAPENKKSKNKKSNPKIPDLVPADFIQPRIDKFELLHHQYNEKVVKIVAEALKNENSIEIELQDGSIKKGIPWKTTPTEIAKGISSTVFDKTIIAKVNNAELWDMNRPLEKSCKLSLLDFESQEGRTVFWHSAAHILGEAAEDVLHCHLCDGPPTNEPPGFYYNFDSRPVNKEDIETMELVFKKIMAEKQPFERLEMTKEDLLEMFSYSPEFKHYFINQVTDPKATVYRCGRLIDFCRGPHVSHTGMIKAFKILKSSSAHWPGSTKEDPHMIQRVAGIAFPSAKLLDEYETAMREARDHKDIGREQHLFFFERGLDSSPGSAYFPPHGTRIYNAMMELLRTEYFLRDYEEVITPTILNSELWKKSGHWKHYADDMFKLKVDDKDWALKPMNCPTHCLMFAERDVSYRQLPWRIADFGVLHRNEASGALKGLTRVRKFCQDDAHIFCEFHQITDEIEGVLNFLKQVYGLFDLKYRIYLSTRPEGFLGNIKTWERAEKILRELLTKFCRESKIVWEENPGDGAFYGPKIDVVITDPMYRAWQCGTIQLDFQLPQQFELEYACPKVEEDAVFYDTKNMTAGTARPVMIHRAIWGSFERMIAMLAEHTGGRWPFWISPRQVLVVPVMPEVNDYAKEIRELLKFAFIYAKAELGTEPLAKKIRNGQTEQYNFIFVVGALERETRCVNVRNNHLGQDKLGRSDMVPLDKAIKALKELKASRNRKNELIIE